MSLFSGAGGRLSHHHPMCHRHFRPQTGAPPGSLPCAASSPRPRKSAIGGVMGMVGLFEATARDVTCSQVFSTWASSWEEEASGSAAARVLNIGISTWGREPSCYSHHGTERFWRPLLPHAPSTVGGSAAPVDHALPFLKSSLSALFIQKPPPSACDIFFLTWEALQSCMSPPVHRAYFKGHPSIFIDRDVTGWWSWWVNGWKTAILLVDSSQICCFRVIKMVS